MIRSVTPFNNLCPGTKLSRVVKYACGVKCNSEYDPADVEHGRRSAFIWRNAAGVDHIPQAFSVILPKDTQVLETKKFRQSFWQTAKTSDGPPDRIFTHILRFMGHSANPQWVDVDPTMYSPLRTIVADTKQFKATRAQGLIKLRGDPTYYYRSDYDVVVNFDLTELTAQLSWKTKTGETRWSPAKLVYEYDNITAPGGSEEESEETPPPYA